MQSGKKRRIIAKINPSKGKNRLISKDNFWIAVVLNFFPGMIYIYRCKILYVYLYLPCPNSSYHRFVRLFSSWKWLFVFSIISLFMHLSILIYFHYICSVSPFFLFSLLVADTYQIQLAINKCSLHFLRMINVFIKSN